MQKTITCRDFKCILEYSAQKVKFSIKDFFNKCDQIRSFLRIWSHLLKKSLMENFIFCAVILSIFYVMFIHFFLTFPLNPFGKHQNFFGFLLFSGA